MKQEGIPSGFLSKIKGTLEKHQMVEPGDTVIVAASGGLDSMTLLESLHLLHKDSGIALVVAHLDHGLRGEESRKESLFVEEQARRYQLPFEAGSLSRNDYPRASSLQNQARILRYQFFDQVKSKWHAQRVALAHHRDDNVETILMRILRGTGPTGLRGIPPVRKGGYIRPLIETARSEIEAFAREKGLLYLEDSSNRKTDYLRNRVRLELLPLLRKRFHVPVSADTLIHMASILDVEDAYLDEVASTGLLTAIACEDGQEIVLKRSEVRSLPLAIRRRVLRMACKRLRGMQYGLPYIAVESVLDGLEGTTPHQVYSLPGGICVYIEYDCLRLRTGKLWEPVFFDVPHPIGESTFIPEVGMRIHSALITVKAEEFRGPRYSNEVVLGLRAPSTEARIRNVQPGDRFYPLGVHHPKKLKDFFIDEKVPRSMRSHVPLVEIGGEIAWVVGYRIDERFKVDPEVACCVRFRAENTKP